MTNALTVRKQAVAQIEKSMTLSRDEYEKAMPPGMDVDRFIRVVRTTVQQTPDLLDCDRNSFFAAAMTCAQLGLEPDPNVGHVDIVVRRTKHGLQAVAQVRYGGYLELARRSGQIRSISVQIVHANDRFTFKYTLEGEVLEHEPALGDAGPPVAVYCIARFTTGGHHVERMTWKEVEAIRDRHSDGWKAYKAGKIRSTPWSTAPEEMAKKTILRRARKMWPMSIVDQRLLGMADRLTDAQEAEHTARRIGRADAAVTTDALLDDAEDVVKAPPARKPSRLDGLATVATEAGEAPSPPQPEDAEMPPPFDPEDPAADPGDDPANRAEDDGPDVIDPAAEPFEWLRAAKAAAVGAETAEAITVWLERHRQEARSVAAAHKGKSIAREANDLVAEMDRKLAAADDRGGLI